MFCKKCGFEIPENAGFCPNCGERFIFTEEPENEKSAENDFRGYYQQNLYSNTNNYSDSGYSNADGGYREPENGAYPPPYYPPVNDKAPELKDYLKWMFLYPLLMFIPGVGAIAYFVICIVRALDKTYVARANYFKALLIAQIVTMVLAFAVIILIVTVFGGIFASGADLFEEAYPEFFEEFAYGVMRMCTK